MSVGWTAVDLVALGPEAYAPQRLAGLPTAALVDMLATHRRGLAILRNHDSLQRLATKFVDEIAAIELELSTRPDREPQAVH